MLMLPDYGLLKISGKDANKLLQGQLTCHVDELDETNSQFGALCNPQGRVISFFVIFMFDQHFYLLMRRDMLVLTQKVLNKYAKFYQATISDVSDNFLLQGIEMNELNDHPTYLKKIIWGESRCILLYPIDSAPSLSPTDFNFTDWQYMNLIEQLPTLYPQTSGLFLPHELNLLKFNAVSFNKGCYTGQEIIARMHYRGHSKKQLYQATLPADKNIAPGDDLYYLQQQTPQACGTVIDTCLKNDIYYLLILLDQPPAQSTHLFLLDAPHHTLTIQHSTRHT